MLRDIDESKIFYYKTTTSPPPTSSRVPRGVAVKPLTVSISVKQNPLVADRRYEVSCESAGSRPPAVITWYKGKRQLRRVKVRTTPPE